MKPTTEQKQWLRDYLYQTMRYRETFEEVYDHILLALDNEPKPLFFESAVMNIINDQFGSDNALYELEQSCKRTADRDSITRYFGAMKLWVRSKLIIFTGLCFSLFCLIGFRYPLAFVLVFFVLSLAPFLIYGLRKMILFFKRSYKKPSLKDEIAKRITYRVTGTIWTVIFAWNGIGVLVGLFNYPLEKKQVTVKHHPDQLDLFSTIPGVMLGMLMAALVTWIALHLITVIKLYQREFTTRMIAQ